MVGMDKIFIIVIFLENNLKKVKIKIKIKILTSKTLLVI
jgi:hypothetical protein